MNKFILDACCGGRMMWQNKEHPNTIYQDKRECILPYKEKYGQNFSVEPDKIGDFTNMDFEDKSFKLIVFDPPHLIEEGTSIMATKYGHYKSLDELKETLKMGFKECWRCLEDNGVLIFKWNEGSLKTKEVLDLIGIEPLFGQKATTGSKTNKKTMWFTFMKIPELALNVLSDEVQDGN